MTKYRKLCLSVALAPSFMAMLAASQAQAVTANWLTTGAVDSSWGTVGNWSAAPAWDGTDVVTMNLASNTSTLDGNRLVSTLNLSATNTINIGTSGLIQICGTGTSTLTTSGISTINSDVKLATALDTANTLTANIGAATTINGNLLNASTGSSALTKFNGQVLTLNGPANTYSGPTTVTAGTLNVGTGTFATSSWKANGTGSIVLNILFNQANFTAPIIWDAAATTASFGFSTAANATPAVLSNTLDIQGNVFSIISNSRGITFGTTTLSSATASTINIKGGQTSGALGVQAIYFSNVGETGLTGKNLAFGDAGATRFFGLKGANTYTGTTSTEGQTGLIMASGVTLATSNIIVGGTATATSATGGPGLYLDQACNLTTGGKITLAGNVGMQRAILNTTTNVTGFKGTVGIPVDIKTPEIMLVGGNGVVVTGATTLYNDVLITANNRDGGDRGQVHELKGGISESGEARKLTLQRGTIAANSRVGVVIGGTAASTYSGGTYIKEGGNMWLVDSSNRLPTNGAVVMKGLEWPIGTTATGGSAGQAVLSLVSAGTTALTQTIGSLATDIDAVPTQTIINLGNTVVTDNTVANNLVVGNSTSTTFSGNIIGGGTLTKVGSGTLNLTGKVGSVMTQVPASDPPTYNLTGGFGGLTTVTGGTLEFKGSLDAVATHLVTFLQGGLSISDNAKAKITASLGAKTMFKTNALTIATAGQLDMENNDFAVQYTGTSPYADLKARVKEGFGAGSVGTGIVSSTGAVAGNTIHALLDNTSVNLTTWKGVAINPTTVLGVYTYIGDANLDGMVTGEDYAAIDGNLGLTGAQWWQGDLNLDGTVTGEDYAAIDGNLGLGTSLMADQAARIAAHTAQFGASYSAALDSAYAAGVVAVPEPTSLGLLVVTGVLSLRRVRRSAR